jgi:tetratricopeptide (TPR) repeat protein
LKVCAGRRPGNPILHRQLAGCYYGEGRFEAAVAEYDRALSLGPDHAETFLLRSVLRVRLGQFDDSLRDIARYEGLAGLRRPGPAARPVLDLAGGTGIGTDPDPAGDFPDDRAAGPRDPDEYLARRTVAFELLKAGREAPALVELDRALAIRPDDLRARYARASLLDRLDREGADRDAALAAEHPQFDALAVRFPKAIAMLHRTASTLLRQGEVTQAVLAARRAVDLADRAGGERFESRMVLARALASGAAESPALRPEAVRRLREAYEIGPGPFARWYRAEPAFAGIRAELGADPFPGPPVSH